MHCFGFTIDPWARLGFALFGSVRLDSTNLAPLVTGRVSPNGVLFAISGLRLSPSQASP